MDSRLLDLCNKEIKELVQNNLIRPSSSPGLAQPYVENAAELERGVRYHS